MSYCVLSYLNRLRTEAHWYHRLEIKIGNTKKSLDESALFRTKKCVNLCQKVRYFAQESVIFGAKKYIISCQKVDYFAPENLHFLAI